jgi:hypothetical protein
LSCCNFVQCIIEQNRVRSSSRCTYTLEESYKFHFTILGSFYKFLGVFKVWNIFGGLNKSENEILTSHSVGPQTSPGLQPTRCGSLPCAAGRKAEWASAWRPGPAREAARGMTTGRMRWVRSRRGHHVRLACTTVQ